jgi:hypothetical protein
MVNKQGILFCLLLAWLLPFMANCGQTPPTKVEVIDLGAREERLENFNNQLANISDESSAQAAITSFAEYVEGEPAAGENNPNAMRAFSVDTISRLARLEITGRQKLLGGMSIAAADSDGIISLEKFTDAANAVKDASVPTISSGEVELIQAGIRSDLPNLAPGTTSPEGTTGPDDPPKNHRPVEAMTPLEALVVGYVMASGDDGSAGPGANKGNLPEEKISQFIEKVTE